MKIVVEVEVDSCAACPMNKGFGWCVHPDLPSRKSFETGSFQSGNLHPDWCPASKELQPGKMVIPYDKVIELCDMLTNDETARWEFIGREKNDGYINGSHSGYGHGLRDLKNWIGRIRGAYNGSVKKLDRVTCAECTWRQSPKFELILLPNRVFPLWTTAEEDLRCMNWNSTKSGQVVKDEYSCECAEKRFGG